MRKEIPLMEHCFFKAGCARCSVMGSWAGPTVSEVLCNEFVHVKVLEAEAKQGPFQF